jgi:hypothetical protein
MLCICYVMRASVQICLRLHATTRAGAGGACASVCVSGSFMLVPMLVKGWLAG